MTVKELTEAVNTLKSETHDALQTVYDELNQGQRKKIMGNEKVKEFLIRYGVITDENSR